MRTRTNIINGKGLAGAGAALDRSFAGGKLALCYEDKDKAQEFMEIAKSNFDFVAVAESEADNAVLSDGIRFVLGIGGSKVAAAVKRLSGDRKFAFIPTDADFSFFIGKKTAEGIYSPEFIYYDSEIFNVENEKICADIYASCFCLFTELSSLTAKDAGRPFCDKGMSGLAESLKNLLLNPVDESAFFSETLRLIKISVDYLNEKGYLNYLTARAAASYGEELYGRFYAAYFTNLMLFSFTKWNFHDMLIPDEKVVLGAKNLNINLSGGRQFLSKEELHKICSAFKSLTDLPKVNYGRIFCSFQSAVCKENPVFVKLNNRGILNALLGDAKENIYNERFKKD